MTSPGQLYLDLVVARVAEPARGWLTARAGDLSENNFAQVYTGVARRCGSSPLEPSTAELAALEAAALPVPRGWPLAAVARAALLVTACARLDREASLRLCWNVFKTGDNEERAALLKTLSLLPEPERFVEIGIEACRSHVQSVFEAIACENPYPARHFPEPNFNQLVLKSFFTGVAVQRIQGLGSRRSPELARMAEAYASERRAAGRSVPDDLTLVTRG